MSRRATSEEIRSAHRSLARRLHPDHQHGRAGAGAAVDAARMRAVNEAWAVLRDPARRAAYDRSLDAVAGGPTSAGAGAGPGPAPAAGPGPSAGPDTVGPPLSATGVGPLTLVAGALPWLAVLGALAAIFVFTAYAGGAGEPEAAGPAPTTVVVDHRGSCVQRTGGFTLIVNCGTVPNEGRIVAQGSVGATCPEGTTAHRVPQQSIVVCTQPTGSG